jgi:5-methylcytosine-specific restriction endonuclease McrA
MDWEDLTEFDPSNDLMCALQACSNTENDWGHSSHKSAKILLKEELFEAQQSLCAYCRRTIKDEDGHVEIDHILPKAPRGTHSWDSNMRIHRRRTGGYPHFTFTIFNLTLACKRCNNRKGSYDHRLNRTIPFTQLYNLDPAYFEWVHPHLHKYSDHIRILKGLIYQIHNGSLNGDAVIYACKLDKISAVEAKSRDRILKRSKSYKTAIRDLVVFVDVIGWDGIADAVSAQFPDVRRRDINRITDFMNRNLGE